MTVKPNPLVGMEECISAINQHFRECKWVRKAEMGRINDRALFNSFRMYYTRLMHSKRERRHFIHYIIKHGVWSRVERKNKNVNIIGFQGETK